MYDMYVWIYDICMNMYICIYIYIHYIYIQYDI